MMRFVVSLVIRLVLRLVAYLATRLSRRTKLRRLAKVIRDQRALAMLPIAYQPIDARWQPHLDDVDVLDGMTALGGFVQVPAGRSPAGAMRGITDEAGTTFGWIGKVGPQRVDATLLISASDTDSYVTVLSPVRAGFLASPPFVHHDRVTVGGPGAALAAHKQRVAAVTGLHTVRTLDELQATLGRLRERTIDWRAAQSPDALLDADLRSILGPRYDDLGPLLAKKLGPQIPEAKVV